MVFDPQNLIKKEGSFIIEKEVCAKAHSCLDTRVIKDFWDGFTYGSSRLTLLNANTVSATSTVMQRHAELSATRSERRRESIMNSSSLPPSPSYIMVGAVKNKLKSRSK